MVKLQTIKTTVSYDLKEWVNVIEFLAETISQLEKADEMGESLPRIYNIYGDALCNSGSTKEGECSIETGRKIFKEISHDDDDDDEKTEFGCISVYDRSREILRR